MGYYERQDIPFHFALAETFTLLDHYHCSLLGPTWPNRMYLMTGMIDPEGQYGGPVISNVVPSPATGTPYTWTTYPERLTEAGISWRVYQEEDDYGTNVLEFFEAFQTAKPGSPLYEGGLTIYPPDRFEWDAKHDKLPTVSWIVPTSGQSEHPAYLPASGRQLPRVEAERGRREPGPVVEDGVHRQLRRERRAVRPRPAAAAARRHAGRVRQRGLEHHAGVHQLADRRRRPGPRRSSFRRGRWAATSPASSSTTRR